MKIAFITTSVIPSTTANSIYSMKMCEALRKRGQEAYLIVPDRSTNLKVKNVYSFYGVTKKFPIIKAKKARPFLNSSAWAYNTFYEAFKLKSDLIYTLPVKTALYSALFGIPFIYEIHSEFLNSEENRAFKFLTTSKALLKIIAITYSLKKYLIKNFSIKEDKISVLSSAVDLERFPKAKYFSWDGRRKLKIGYCGHLYKGRGIDIILDIAVIMPKFEFKIIGGNKEDIVYWKNKARSRRINNVFFEGFLPPNKVTFYLAKMDILLMPYQKKIYWAENTVVTMKWASPMKMFDYMASGKPIIASDLPVIKEVLRDKKNCLLVPCNNAVKWKETIEILINNPEFAFRIGKNARKEVEKKYTWDIRARKILEYI